MSSKKTPLRRTKKFEKKDYEESVYHVSKIYNNPELLNLEGLVSDNIIMKLKEPELINPMNNTHTIDIIFVCETPSAYEIFAIEQKGGLKRRTISKGIYQLSLARNFFYNNWREFLQSHLQSLDEVKPVYLTTALAYYDIYMMRYGITRAKRINLFAI